MGRWWLIECGVVWCGAGLVGFRLDACVDLRIWRWKKEDVWLGLKLEYGEWSA